MTAPVQSPYRVPFDGGFQLGSCATAPPPGTPGRKALKATLAEHVDDLEDLQRRLYAEGTRSLLCVFQAMDAAGKDSTIRNVFSGVNPAGCEVTSFKRPSSAELDHDFLWRHQVRLPLRGRIGVHNRSHYEEVLVVRVHPGLLAHRGQALPRDAEAFWASRLARIRDWEAHLAASGTTILKFFLHVSPDEQRRRFLARLDTPRKRWKFNEGDLAERALWPRYQQAYEQALGATSRPEAPWYVVPADDKPFLRATVAELVKRTLVAMDPRYPELSTEDLARIPEWREALASGHQATSTHRGLPVEAPRG